MKTYEEVLARRAANKQYNQDVRDEWHDNWIENQIAYHKDRIAAALRRADITGRIAPDIAASQEYQTYQAHLIARHQRKIKKLELELNGKLYGQDQDIAEIVPVIQK